MAATGTEAVAASLVVRRIAPEDAAAVAELSAQLGYEVSVKAVSERILELSHCEQDQAAFVACVDAKAVGWIEAAITRHLSSSPRTEITGLVVQDGMRSMGVGRRLCAEVEAWSKSRGIFVVRVRSRTTRERAHRFYLRDGYSQTKTQVVFEKSLS